MKFGFYSLFFCTLLLLFSNYGKAYLSFFVRVKKIAMTRSFLTCCHDRIFFTSTTCGRLRVFTISRVQVLASY